ncbi:MAG TPA: ribosomal protein S18-alanine N-acetyltransferase [Selenomonadales bacterium]|nr:ribosomal protein S18-alanine N-acetyltransferase [Selenomonadales bacterium]
MGKTTGHLPVGKVRPMGPADIDAVLAVEEASFLTPWSRAAFEAEMGDNELARYLVMEADGAVVGYAGMWMILDEAHVTNIAIAPAFRGKGLGTVLVTALIDFAVRLGATCMTLEVRVSNLDAQRLYRRLGFEPRGLRPGYYSDSGEDALIMWRDDLA